MYKEKIEELRAFMESSKEKIGSKIDELVKDGRNDDAKAFRAALNIYDVFAATIGAFDKTAKGDETVFITAFKTFAANIPAKWRAALEEAKKHNDAGKVLIEEGKLNSSDAIIAKFDELFAQEGER
ncbi:MAG: hypothetical protein K5796_11230 [Lachnospiraceae bacterium]|jgi:xylose isomerase|nr:hypothetical protein [Lachnospiraceae bacterium]